MLIGGHVSIAGGIDQAITRGENIGAKAIQTFASSPRTLSFIPITKEIKQRYQNNLKASSIKFHVFHAIYLVNLASENKDFIRNSINSLIHYQKTAALLNVYGTIFHVGSHKGLGFDAVKNSISYAIAEVVKDSPLKVKLIIENAAGHKGTVGQSVEEIAFLVNKVISLGVNINQLGICLDTQHAFASGINAQDPEILDRYLQEIDKKIGIQLIKVIHINDSKTPLGSHKDRHENIGSGLLGNKGLSNWLHHPLLSSKPFIMEVPGINKAGANKIEMDKLINLL